MPFHVMYIDSRDGCRVREHRNLVVSLSKPKGGNTLALSRMLLAMMFCGLVVVKASVAKSQHSKIITVVWLLM